MTKPKKWAEGTVGEYLEHLLPGSTKGPVPIWPADLFAVTASVLRRTGLYTKLVELLGKGEEPPVDPKLWPTEAKGIAKAWRDAINAGSIHDGELRPLGAIPDPVEQDWQALLAVANLPIYATRRSRDAVAVAKLARALLRLTLVADECSAGVGIRLHPRDHILNFGDFRIFESGGRSIAWKVHLGKARVLPKQHTPQRGMTLRSLTHHLALIGADEVDAVWSPASVLRKEDRARLDVFNVLVLPWPRVTVPRDFHSIDGAAPVPALPPRFRYFSVDHSASDETKFEEYMKARLKTAKDVVGDIDAVVLPELALTAKELARARTLARDAGLILVAGASLGSEDRTQYKGQTNVAVIDLSGLVGKGAEVQTDVFTYFQRKHHRWCLDRDQIVHYGLGGVLPASHDCWELTDIGEREVNFFTLDSWLTFCVLVCEDLARQDPLADAIRSVGPNLVIALLMDGPQLSGRWPSRYASVLAEDPGCSVLTVTSLGMSQLSRPREAGRTSRGKVVGLWRDVQYGERELELEEDHDAAVLSLVCKRFEEFSADGRGDGATAFFPVFAGWRSLK